MAVVLFHRIKQKPPLKTFKLETKAPDDPDELAFDIYTCEHRHLLIVEHKPEWTRKNGDIVMTAVACNFDKGVADYETTVKEPELSEAIQQLISRRKGVEE